MSDILIVGGGIIGMLTARELSLAGMKVTIVDQKDAGQESSWAGGGIISPLYPWRYPDAVSALAKWGQHFYPELVEEIKSETGLDAELIHNGLLILNCDEQSMALDWAKHWQVQLELVDSADVFAIEPALSASIAAKQKAIWLSAIAQVRNPRLVKATKKYLLKQGVTFIEQTEVVEILQQGKKVLGVRTHSGNINADKVLIAGGAWSSNLLKNINIHLDVAPVKGQMILFKTPPESIKRIVLSKDRYVIPRKDGRVLVGSTLEHTGFEKNITTEAYNDLRSEAARMIPMLADIQVEHHWAGLRPGSTNGIPYICAVPEIEGVYVNTGHFRNGVVLGPASARLMADIILAREPILEIEPYKLGQAG